MASTRIRRTAVAAPLVASLHPNGAGAAAVGSALADYVTTVPAAG